MSKEEIESDFSDDTPKKRLVRGDKKSKLSHSKKNKLHTIIVGQDFFIKKHIDVVIINNPFSCTLTLPSLPKNRPTNNILYRTTILKIVAQSGTHQLKVSKPYNNIVVGSENNASISFSGTIDLISIGNSWYKL
jgi:hypothetical protein